MADGTWLDMYVVRTGKCERVRINAIHIFPDHDAVTVYQNFRVTPDAAGLTQFEMDVDAEDIMYMVPTACETVDDVVAIEAPRRTQEQTDSLDDMKQYAMHAVVDLTGGTVMKLMEAMASGHGRWTSDIIDQRHLVLWAMFEMCDESPSSLCFECGWRSPMPFSTARAKFQGTHADAKWGKLIKEIVLAVHKSSGCDWSRSVSNGWKDECFT